MSGLRSKQSKARLLGLFLLRLEARGKFGAESLVTAHDGNCS